MSRNARSPTRRNPAQRSRQSKDEADQDMEDVWFHGADHDESDPAQP